jgi:hypothetical protein
MNVVAVADELTGLGTLLLRLVAPRIKFKRTETDTPR